MLALALAAPAAAGAHAGPPYPIIANQAAGPYLVSVWVDPDATDDGSTGGQFWVMLRLADGRPLPAATRVRVSIAPATSPNATRATDGDPVDGDVARQFAALVMDHEGRFAVRTTISGGAGPASIDAEVDATYDQRPPPALLAVYLMPFLIVGFLWFKLLRQRPR